MSRNRIVTSVVTAAITLVSQGSVALSDAKSDFEMLFGAEEKKVTASKTTLDDAIFAGKLLDAAKSTSDSPQLQILLRQKAYAFGMKHRGSYAKALEAVEFLLAACAEDPAKRKYWQEQKMRVLGLQYKQSYGKARKAAGEAYLGVLVAFAENRASAGDIAGAVELYRKAYPIAAYLGPDWAKGIIAKGRALVGQMEVSKRQRARFNALRAKLAKDPTDAKARETLILYYLLDLDCPDEAAKIVNDEIGEALRTYVPLAAMGLDQVAEPVCLELGEWYERLAAKASPSGKAHALARAMTYYQRFLVVHEKQDALVLKAKLAMKRIEAQGVAAGPAPPSTSGRLPGGPRRGPRLLRFPDTLGATPRTYGLCLDGDRLWIGTDRGLICYQTERDKWSVFAKELPGDYVSSVVAYGGKAIVRVYTRTRPGYVSSSTYIFSPQSGQWKRFPYSAISMKILRQQPHILWYPSTRIDGERICARDLRTERTRTYPTGSLVRGRIMDLVGQGKYIYVTKMGEYDRTTRSYNGGGVVRIDPATGRGRSYTEKTGISHSYCYKIVAGKRKIWVSHSGVDRGLSVFDTTQDKWAVIRKSGNGMILGGTRLALTGKTLWIDQSTRLVEFNTETLKARIYTEANGLPGRYITGLAAAENAVWVSACTYSGDEVSSAGIARLSVTAEAPSAPATPDAKQPDATHPKTPPAAAQPQTAPKVVLKRREETTVRGRAVTRYYLAVTNWADFPAELFQPAPDLPPIGRITNATRIRVHIQDAKDDRHLYGFVTFDEPSDLSRIYFPVPTGQSPPKGVYVLLKDRRTDAEYKSNTVTIGS